MQLNVLNDLAEAMKALGGKKLISQFTFLQHAIERIKRRGGSQEALDKKKTSFRLGSGVHG